MLAPQLAPSNVQPGTQSRLCQARNGPETWADAKTDGLKDKEDRRWVVQGYPPCAPEISIAPGGRECSPRMGSEIRGNSLNA